LERRSLAGHLDSLSLSADLEFCVFTCAIGCGERDVGNNEGFETAL
jgi:hypothetical protein